MAFQTENLVMIGLGVADDQPPDEHQPKLADGIHLRWAFKRGLGFPWHGFHLYRRQHWGYRPGDLKCLKGSNPGLQKGEYFSNELEVSDFLIESDQLLVFTDDFPVYAKGTLELDLGGRQFVRVSHPGIGPSRAVVMHIGFRWAKDAGCVLAFIILLIRALASIAKGNPKLAQWLYSLFVGLIYFFVKNYYRKISVEVAAMFGAAPVIKAQAKGYPGQIVPVYIESDAITAVRLGPGEAALVDFCSIPFSASHPFMGWEPAPGFPAPLCLPVVEEAYPCNAGTSFDAEELALGRVLYGKQEDWAGENFSQLHEQLQALVKDGPLGIPMAERSVKVEGVAEEADPNIKAPVMPAQKPLDMVLLGALHPALAQMVGLYWVDQLAEPDVAYDYLIVAAHTPFQFEPDAEDAPPGDYDGWIVFNKTMTQAAPLPAPNDLRAYALPISPGISPQKDSGDASNCIGLRWNLETAGNGIVMANRPVMYHLRRLKMGNEEEPVFSGEADFITRDAPVLVLDRNAPPGETLQQAADWPPFPLHYIDDALDEGWYSHAVIGVDIFGRHSQASEPASWWQWAPAPNPPPWYYKTPASDEVVHPSAVRLLDKLPPPPPAGIEAHALDPRDPTVLQDDAYQKWRATLSPDEQQSLIGLRVRWRWTHQHARQAPDAREFRIYYHPGIGPPTDYETTTNWQTRLRVVDFDENVTVSADAQGQPLRTYELILPAAADKFREGLPLQTSLAAPIAYAHVGVSAADDKKHTGDAPQWTTGHWGERFGNEGHVGAAVKVFRVHRVKPVPPVPPPDSDKVFATPADYHGRSFYTYRWQPSDFLRTHIFRALDDAVFKQDLRQGARAPLDQSSPGVFPENDTRWGGLLRQKVADEINLLYAFVKNATAAQALERYRLLSNDALRVLAGLPGNEHAFTQLTIQPLDPNDPLTANRRGPDDPDSFFLNDSNNPLSSGGLRVYLDTLDGRSNNRYFYRAAYVDGAHNRGPLGLSSPPVWLPNVVAPRTPVITKVLGGDREIILKWASNREPDLAAYRVYRAPDKTSARDVRLMTLVHTQEVKDGDAASRPAEVSWTDKTVPGLVTFYYRVAAVDTDGNTSAASQPVAGRAFDDALPVVPTLVVKWTADTPPLAHVTWTATEETLLERRAATEVVWIHVTDWLSAGTQMVDDPVSPAFPWFYRLRVRKQTGALALGAKVGLPRKGV